MGRWGLIALLLLACAWSLRQVTAPALGRDLVDDDSFGPTALQSEGPVLVEFWAGWCGYCRQLEPAMDRLADRYRGRLKLVKLDYDASPKTNARYGVSRLPTLLMFRGGRLLARQEAPAEDELVPFVEDALAADGPNRPPSNCVPGPGVLSGVPICD